MEDRLRAVAKKVWPVRETMSGPEQSVWSHNVTMLVYAVPLALLGLLLLFDTTDLRIIRAARLTLLLLFILGLLFGQLRFFRIIEIQPGRFVDIGTRLNILVVWPAALLFGSSALWLAVLWWVIRLAQLWPQARSTELRRATPYCAEHAALRPEQGQHQHEALPSSPG